MNVVAPEYSLEHSPGALHVPVEGFVGDFFARCSDINAFHSSEVWRYSQVPLLIASLHLGPYLHL